MHVQQHHTANGYAPETSQTEYLQRRLSAAEANAEGARTELLRACQEAEAAAADVARCRTLEQRLQVSLAVTSNHPWTALGAGHAHADGGCKCASKQRQLTLMWMCCKARRYALVGGPHQEKQTPRQLRALP